MDGMEGNNWEFGDLNTAMMAAIMAEQIARSKRMEEAEKLKRLQELETLKGKTHIYPQPRTTTIPTTSTTLLNRRPVIYPDYNPTATIFKTESTTENNTTKLISSQSIANNTIMQAAAGLSTTSSLSLLNAPSNNAASSNQAAGLNSFLNEGAYANIFEQITIGAVCVLFQILLIMAYRIHRNSISLKQKTLLQLLIVMLPFIEIISMFMAFNNSFDTTLGIIMIGLICTLGLFLYLSVHLIMKPNATIPINGPDDGESKFGVSKLSKFELTNFNDSLFGCGPAGDGPSQFSFIESVKSSAKSTYNKFCQKCSSTFPSRRSSKNTSKFDLEENGTNLTNLTLNDSTLGCGPTGDQASKLFESGKSGDSLKPEESQLKTRTPLRQSSPKPKKSSLVKTPRPSAKTPKPPSRSGTPVTGRVTPSGRKTPNSRNVSFLTRSWEKRLNDSKTINVSPLSQKSTKSSKDKTKSPKAKTLPPVRNTKVRQMTETEVEKLNSKWNGKYNQEIGQNLETLEVKVTKEKIKKPK